MPGPRPTAARCGRSPVGQHPRIGAIVISKSRFQRPKEETGKRLRINERIRISPIRLIDDENNQLGIVETADALRKAREVGLDLVEVAPNSQPPVCRIMDYGKWKYQQKKKEQKAKAHSKQSELKEVRLRPGTDDHDIEIKNNKAREFFADGHKVQFTILFKGRQMAHREIGFDLFREIEQKFEDCAHVEMRPRVQGRRMTMLMAPGKTKAAAAASRPAPARRAPAPGNDGTPSRATQDQPEASRVDA